MFTAFAIGILLHFDGPALEDQYFVDPQWLCDMLANVITIRDVNPFIKNGRSNLNNFIDCRTEF